jgi:outer membrane protein assembly factor BamB
LTLALVACGSGGVFRPTDGGGAKDLAINFGDGGGPVCSPNDPPGCDGTSIATCRSDGSGYDYSPCATGCINGVCTCNPGDVQCSGQDVQTCQNDGTWMTTSTCANGMNCMNGSCGDARCADEVNSTNPHALPTNAWPRFRHDNRNTGSTPAKVAAMPKMKWKTFIGGSSYGGQLGALVSGAVVNQNNVLYIGAGDGDGMGGNYYSLDATGKKVWTFSAQRGLGLSTPAVRADATSYFASSSAQLFGVDPMGKQVFVYIVGSVADSNPIVTKDGTLIYSSDDGSLYALDATGKLIWKSDPQTGPGEVDGGLAESCDGKILAGGALGWTQLDAMTGKTEWRISPHGAYPAMVCSSPLVDASGVMYGFEFDGTGSAIDPTGKVLWQKAFPGGAGGAPAKIGNTLFVVLNDGNMHAIDATTGVEKWSKPVGNGQSIFLLAGPVVDGNNTIYFNSHDGYVYAFDTTGKQLWRIAASGLNNTGHYWAGNIAIGNDGTMYVPGNDGNLYAFK